MDIFKSSPIISVLMSVYNGEPYLSKAVESILSQTFSDFEFVIINDGSADGSSAILRKYYKQDSRIRLVEQQNQGLTRSLNFGLRLARGKYIARMDADDFSMPKRLEIQVDYLDNHPRCVAVGSEVMLVDPEGWPISLRKQSTCHEEIEAQLLKGNGGAMTHPVVTMRKSAVVAIGGYNEKFVTAQDIDLFLKLSEVGRLHNLSDVLLHWRQHAKSMNHTKYHTWQGMKSQILKDAYRRRGLDLKAPEIAEHSYPSDIRFSWCLQAYKTSNYSTAIKNMILSMLTKGITKEHISAMHSLYHKFASRKILNKRP